MQTNTSDTYWATYGDKPQCWNGNGSAAAAIEWPRQKTDFSRYSGGGPHHRNRSGYEMMETK